jgi:hypothetical protein
MKADFPKASGPNTWGESGHGFVMNAFLSSRSGNVGHGRRCRAAKVGGVREVRTEFVGKLWMRGNKGGLIDLLPAINAA